MRPRSRTSLLAAAFAGVWALLVPALRPLAAAEIILSAQDAPAVRQFTSELATLRPDDQVRFVPFAELVVGPLPAPGTRLILIGEEALAWRLKAATEAPTLIMRLSRLEARRLLDGAPPAHISVLWNDPPLDRQLKLLHLLLPHVRRVGVLYDAESQYLLDPLRAAAAPLQLEIVAREWPNPRDSRPLLELLEASEVLLGFDSANLFNSLTAKSLLLTSYARQRALIGPNAAFVRAGSLSSTFSDQDDWLHSLDELLEQPPGSWPKTLYPAHFKVLSNPQVARALGIALDADAELAKRLAAGENSR
jgi:ABC-type uncharacterized transport system substrate-binding protein